MDSGATSFPTNATAKIIHSHSHGMNCINVNLVTVVTVTYGNRKALLEQMISACIDNGIYQYVIVDNGVSWAVNSFEQQFPECKFVIVRLEANKGPAVGYYMGIRTALEISANLIWLLDDDLCPESGCLEELIKNYNSLIGNDKEKILSVLATRPSYLACINPTSRNNKTPLNISHSLFFGFSITQLPERFISIGKRFFLKDYKAAHYLNVNRNQLKAISIDVAPYGGLLFAASNIDKIGLPDQDFILYVDDYEFSHRFKTEGDGIYLIPNARLRDIDPRVQESKKKRSGLFDWLYNDSFRVFYAARNLSYFERRLSSNSFLYLLNKSFYLLVLLILAIRFRRFTRYLLILDAVRQGARGCLGYDVKHSLPK